MGYLRVPYIQYKKVQRDNTVDLKRERAKEAGIDDIFCVFFFFH